MQINYEWALQQMQDTKVKNAEGQIVLKLLKLWESIESPDPTVTKNALEIFSAIAQGHSLHPESSNETWVELQPGNIRVADEVRVKHNAFPGETGEFHNGRRGKVVAVRYGDVIFRSIDGRDPFLDGVHYAPSALEKRVS